MEPIILPPCKNPKVPQQTIPFRHRVDCQTRFNDFDIFGHLNNTIYMAFLDLGKATYYNDVLGNVFDFTKTTAVIVNVNVSFCSPTYMEEPLTVLTGCSRISRHSFTLDQRVVNPLTGDVKCYASTVLAAFDAKTATGAEVPPEWVKAASDFENWPETPIFASETPNNTEA